MVNEVIRSERVHLRRVAGDGDEFVRHVHCRMQDHFVDIETCSDCPRMFALNHTARGVSMMCRLPADRVAPHQAPVRPGARGKATQYPTAGDVMPDEVVCVTADTRVDALMNLLLKRSFSGAPVIDGRGKAIGIVSKTDLVQLLEDRVVNDGGVPITVRTPAGLEYELGPGFHVDELSAISVGDIMSPLVFSIHVDTPVTQAAAMMAYDGVHRVPVLDDDGSVIGLLSAIDVMRWLGREAGYAISNSTDRQLE
jgi:CBS domain-containing protein